MYFQDYYIRLVFRDTFKYWYIEYKSSLAETIDKGLANMNSLFLEL